METFTDKKRLIDATCVMAFVHIGCGLIRFLINETAAVAVDWVFAVGMLTFAGWYALKHKPGRPKINDIGAPQLTALFMFLWCALSTLANLIYRGGHSVFYSPNALIDTLMLAALFFPLGTYMARRGVPRIARVLTDAFMGAWTLLIIYVLINVFSGREVVLTGGRILGIDDFYKSLALNNNPNSTACIECAFMTVAVLLVYKAKGAAQRSVYALCILVHFAALVLTNSRTYFAIALLPPAVLCFCSANAALNKKGRWLRVLLALLAALALIALMSLLRELVFSLQALTNDMGENMGEVKPFITPEMGTFSYRTEIWEAALNVSTGNAFNLLFGVGIANSRATILEMVGRELYTHNQTLEIALCVGMPCALGFIWLTLQTLWAAAKLSLKRPPDAVNLFMAACLAGLCFSGLLEAHLMFYRRPASYAFFIICAFICERARSKNM
ncbi:MAG: O-antigen ligase family protein [Clostridia bacterium]|nr:O-antigen ligase family protein [Clostridia bacterium]